MVADDGVGLGPGVEWPTPGKMAALITKSLVQNANARIEVNSEPGNGVRVTIFFDRADAEPDAPTIYIGRFRPIRSSRMTSRQLIYKQLTAHRAVN